MERESRAKQPDRSLHREEKSRFTEQQIVGILKESEAGAKTAELCRKHGVSPVTFYKWKSKSGGMEVTELIREQSPDFAVGQKLAPTWSAIS